MEKKKEKKKERQDIRIHAGRTHFNIIMIPKTTTVHRHDDVLATNQQASDTNDGRAGVGFFFGI